MNHLLKKRAHLKLQTKNEGLPTKRFHNKQLQKIKISNKISIKTKNKKVFNFKLL